MSTPIFTPEESDNFWHKDFQRVIDEIEIETYYQPVVDLRTHEVVGYEALSRFPTINASINDIFAYSASQGLSLKLDLTAIAVALKKIDQLPEQTFLAINVCPATLESSALPALLSHEMPRERIVLEITEHAKIVDFLPIYKQLRMLRERGVKLAMNDVGSGFNGLANIVNLQPDIIKIDRFLIDGIDAWPSKRIIVEAIRGIATSMRTSLIAEGVETYNEARWLSGMGLRLAQGFLFAEPTPEVDQRLIIEPNSDAIH